MRAKMRLANIQTYNDADGNPIQENLRFSAVCKSGAYPADGSDEDNTFSKFTPNAELTMTVQNPALIGTMQAGEKYYVDFTRTD
jgi:hypothetical protein